MHDRAQRRARILALVRSHRIRSQGELRDRLRESGLAVNQATLSRDLRDLGVRKGPAGYEVPGTAGEPVGPALDEAIAQWLREATAVQQLVVAKTPPGGAAPLALAFDRASPPDLVGTLAGDDTALLICRDAGSARRLTARLLSLRGDDA
jgi:transcriptional regulator of arginine metabolism